MRIITGDEEGDAIMTAKIVEWMKKKIFFQICVLLNQLANGNR